MKEWREETICDLKQYRYWQESLRQIPGMLEALAAEAAAVRCSLPETEPISGGNGNYGQERLTHILLQREKLSHRYDAVKKQVALLEEALGYLEIKERKVLESFFICRQPDSIPRLCQELGYEERQIYNIKEKALHKLTILRYGPDSKELKTQK